jgi:hypothetical protein
LGLPAECANYRNANGESLAVPDVIVHRRGHDGPNVLVLEMKKTSNPRRATATVRACGLFARSCIPSTER